ncbi:DNA adenine methylase [Nitrobacter sp.]|uniref:DNA adenine methylase n=1 Tax=Nitrobacter sp. TaxID=29420 RepID=UPI003F652D48
MSSPSPTRPVLRWHGGKWKLAPWIIGHFPSHRVYVEPFGGAGSVLLRKARSYAEVYNDLDDDVVGLFRVLQDPASANRLLQLLEITPFARCEFEIAWDATEDPVERARRLIIRAFMGFGSNAHNNLERGHKTTGFRANSSRSGTTPAQDWTNYPDALAHIIIRMRGVIVEHRDAVAVMAAHDAPETLHYVDPPYLPETRSPANKYDGKYRMYRHELDRSGHTRLLTSLRDLAGFVVLSGYPDALYDDALPDWRRIETRALADGARERIEVLWINPACAAALDREGRSARQMTLLELANGPACKAAP